MSVIVNIRVSRFSQKLSKLSENEICQYLIYNNKISWFLEFSYYSFYSHRAHLCYKKLTPLSDNGEYFCPRKWGVVISLVAPQNCRACRVKTEQFPIPGWLNFATIKWNLLLRVSMRRRSGSSEEVSHAMCQVSKNHSLGHWFIFVC